MVNPNRKRGGNCSGGSSRENRSNNNNMDAWEENTMAILDSSGFKDSQDVHDDRICNFLSFQAWSPFNLASGGERTAKDSCSLFDSVVSERFSTLIEDMVQAVNKLSFDLVIKASMRNLLLFQYLVNVLEEDLLPRLTVYKVLYRNTELVTSQGICTKYSSEADMHGLTSRLDGFRCRSFFHSLCSIRVSSVRTRRSNEKSDGATLAGMLNNFSTAANTKNIVKRVTSGAAQLLLAHAFQVSSLDSL
ncbi:hypothetical protein BHE74_00022047 [Ensete ventricosum]|nr:hypothetical protein GW17_00038672 [Ensete ventricosum]RWW70280.1 hypothetical protein BHE74_00022047 [Ensete ventricosum]RZS00377.1 hypothetical protein BHM03_00030068 [Ensete ventricosum]